MSLLSSWGGVGYFPAVTQRQRKLTLRIKENIFSAHFIPESEVRLL